jgi:hypothetical protein
MTLRPEVLPDTMQKAGGLWDPGGRRWLIERKRMGPLIRNLRRVTDPLFRQAGIDLDE